MTKDFEVLSEGPLRTTDFGEGASHSFPHLQHFN